MGIHDLWLFVAAGILLNLTPGPDMALVIARSTQHGTRAGIAAALGIGVGTFGHIAAAAVGISAVLMASALAFAIIKVIGALYLIYLGLRMIWSSFGTAPQSQELERSPQPSLAAMEFRACFLQGMLTNLLNPKVALFFLAFLPQFIDADAPSKTLAFVSLGLLFDLTGTLWNLGVAVIAGWLGASSTFGRIKSWLERVIGALFVGVGVKLALSERP